MLAAGEIEIPEGWETTLQITLREPDANRLVAPLAKKKTAGPRANITIRRFPSSVADARSAFEQFLVEVKTVPRFRAFAEQAIRFADGREGISVTIELEAAPGIKIAQRHAFRVDDGIVTQIAATVEIHRASDLEGHLASIMLSFRL
jgi:hypothetical protein